MAVYRVSLLLLIGATIGAAIHADSYIAQENEKQKIWIEFTEVPIDGAGPDSRGDIAGRIIGAEAPGNYRIVLYAHTDWWYVQPLVSAPFTDVSSDSTWSNWTHLGHRYGALLVRSSFKPEARIQSLPNVGGDVIAKAEVAARKE